MARSNIRRRQEAERQRNSVYDATLRRVCTVARPAPNIQRAIEEAHRGLGLAVRDAASWRPKLKTRDPGRLRLAAARHLFALYPVPSSLERIWLDSGGLDADEVMLRKSWYVAAAGGGSLFKAGASQWLSRKEVHWFLNPPAELGFEEAFWQAIARGLTEDIGLALRIARSKIARSPRDDIAFWREAARFFCLNPVPLNEIEDLCDFLVACREQNGGYGLKGRSLNALRRAMGEWHHDLAAVRQIEVRRQAALRARLRDGEILPDNGSWKGSVLTDWSWQPSAAADSARKVEFFVTQLKTAAELVAESRAMHHCVWSYAGKCIAGNASIWSVRRQAPGRSDRLLTVEVDRQNRAVQIRGFANRLANADEQAVLARWAKARGIYLP